MLSNTTARKRSPNVARLNEAVSEGRCGSTGALVTAGTTPDCSSRNCPGGISAPQDVQRREAKLVWRWQLGHCIAMGRSRCCSAYRYPGGLTA